MKRMSRCGAVRAEVLCASHTLSTARTGRRHAHKGAVQERRSRGTLHEGATGSKSDVRRDAHFLYEPPIQNFIF